MCSNSSGVSSDALKKHSAVPCRGCDPDFLFVVPGNDDLLHGVFPLRLMPYADYTPCTRHVPLR